MKKIISVFLATTFVVLGLGSFSQAQDYIAVLDEVQGDVFIIRNGQNLRAQKDSYLLPGDTVMISSNASATLTGTATGCTASLSPGSMAVQASSICSPRISGNANTQMYIERIVAPNVASLAPVVVMTSIVVDKTTTDDKKQSSN